MKKIEHIGIAVKNLEASEKLFESLLGCQVYKRETVESEGVITSFLRIGETKIELLAPTHENSPIAKFLEKRGEGIHHIAFEVENIEQAISEKNAAGFELIHFKAKSGADNKLIAFLHPKSTGGVLTELCQDKIN
jgi:methylmalonyl-CoA/ethylmalonyl-CoA epimerase